MMLRPVWGTQRKVVHASASGFCWSLCPALSAPRRTSVVRAASATWPAPIRLQLFHSDTSTERRKLRCSAMSGCWGVGQGQTLLQRGKEEVVCEVHTCTSMHKHMHGPASLAVQIRTWWGPGPLQGRRRKPEPRMPVKIPPDLPTSALGRRQDRRRLGSTQMCTGLTPVSVCLSACPQMPQLTRQGPCKGGLQATLPQILFWAVLCMSALSVAGQADQEG